MQSTFSQHQKATLNPHHRKQTRTATRMLRAALLPALVCLASCSTLAVVDPSEDPSLQGEIDREATYVAESGFSFWNAHAAKSTAPLRVTIDLSEQAAHIHRGDELIGRIRVATGKPGHRTPTGSFTIIEKTRDKRSNLYGKILDSQGAVVIADADSRRHSPPPGGKFVGAAMPYWMRLTNSGIGMHAGPIPRPGEPASHGCIRMPPGMVQRLFAEAPIGTPVEIRP